MQLSRVQTKIRYFSVFFTRIETQQGHGIFILVYLGLVSKKVEKQCTKASEGNDYKYYNVNIKLMKTKLC